MSRPNRQAPPPPDPENGLWQGRSVARRFVSPDGFTVLVGRTAEDNDVLTLKLGSPRDFWLHVAAGSGSHVVVRNPEGLDRLPKETDGTYRSRLVDVLASDERAAALYRASGERGGRRLDLDQVLLFRLRDGVVSEVLALPSDARAFEEFWSRNDGRASPSPPSV